MGLISVHTSPLAQPGTGDGGGLNVYVRETAMRLAARGIHVDIYTRWDDPDLPETVILTDGVEVHHIEAGPQRPLPKGEVANLLCAFVLGLQRHPSAGMHDVLHAHYWLSGWVGRRVAQRWGTPMVQTFHTLGLLKNATLAPGDVPEPALRLVAEQRVATEADRLLVLTCGEARLLHRSYGISGQRLTVVPAGVDLDLFRPRSLPPAVARDPELLFVGRLQPLKGPDIAVRILAEVRRSRPTARLRIIGGTSGTGAGSTGPQDLRDLATSLGVADAVTIEAAVDQRDLVARYHTADVVLAPSRSETFGLVALEAQACGVPVVAAAVAGLEAVVGDGGILVPGHDPTDHAAAVLRYLDDPTFAAVASQAGITTGRRSSWERTVDRLANIYAEVAADARRASDGARDDAVAVGA
ncbi:MAG: glycosyltransferase [Intrasporangiaceae bacterium]|nr:glycosyltransferase [Intrasporangiaceae bacterium]